MLKNNTTMLKDALEKIESKNAKVRHYYIWWTQSKNKQA